MNYPSFFQNGNHAFAVVLSEEKYIEVRKSDHSQQISFGPSPNYIKQILELYQPIDEEAFLKQFKNQLLFLTNLKDEL